MRNATAQDTFQQWKCEVFPRRNNGMRTELAAGQQIAETRKLSIPNSLSAEASLHRGPRVTGEFLTT
jgi:hypothetical protein